MIIRGCLLVHGLHLETLPLIPDHPRRYMDFGWAASGLLHRKSAHILGFWDSCQKDRTFFHLGSGKAEEKWDPTPIENYSTTFQGSLSPKQDSLLPGKDCSLLRLTKASIIDQSWNLIRKFRNYFWVFFDQCLDSWLWWYPMWFLSFWWEYPFRNDSFYWDNCSQDISETHYMRVCWLASIFSNFRNAFGWHHWWDE